MTMEHDVMPPAGSTQPVHLAREDLALLFNALKDDGYRLVGPTLQAEAIVYDTIEGVDDLPEGWTDEQDGGTYRLHRRDDQALFGYNVGPYAWKRFLHAPRQRLWQATSNKGDLSIQEETPKPEKLAFIGVRSCELHAMAIQDRVFLEGPYVEPHYAAQRGSVFVVAVNCTQAGGTCFCTSMQTGPEASVGYDLALTEVISDSEHYFLARAGSAQGAGVLNKLSLSPATEAECNEGARRVSETASQMGRKLDTSDIKELLYRNLEHPRWDDVADRCLTCGNCTLACPTCFCTTVEDTTDLSGNHAERWRTWDSCFTMDFSYIHGGSVRTTNKARYRQWMTHKLASWHDQFGTSGCVGCGRCITWCPVGIDITEEVKAIRETEPESAASGLKGV